MPALGDLSPTYAPNPSVRYRIYPKPYTYSYLGRKTSECLASTPQEGSRAPFLANFPNLPDPDLHSNLPIISIPENDPITSSLFFPTLEACLDARSRYGVRLVVNSGVLRTEYHCYHYKSITRAR
jgi:hypothetical protein